MTMRAIYSCLVIVLILLAGCSTRTEEPAPAPAPRPAHATRADDGSLAQVGGRAITAEMVAQRRRHIDMYYPGTSSPEGALAQLVQGYLAVELLRREGIDLDRRTLLAERDRIDRQSRDRGRLERIKALYADDEEAYLRVGILPDFARSRLERHFHATPRFGEPARQAAAALLDEVASDATSFAARASARGAVVSRLLADPAIGMRPIVEKADDPSGVIDLSPGGAQVAALRDEMSAAASDRDRAAAARLVTLLAGRGPGEVHPNTLESPGGYHAVRLLRRRSDGAIEIDLAVFSRPDFHAWFWAEARHIPVAIHDDARRATFLANIEWARSLAIAP